MTNSVTKVASILLGIGLLVDMDLGLGNAQTEISSSFPAETVQSWATVGARPGWFRRGEHLFVFRRFGKSQFLPAFLVRSWKPGALAKLPSPSIAFGLEFAGTGLANQDLRDLRHLVNLHTLKIANTRVTNGGLKHVAHFGDLEVLALNDTMITGLNELTRLKRLQSLRLSNTKITDSGLKEVGKLKSLWLLDLSYTRIRDEALREISTVEGLRELHLAPK